jgi:hypothetical protein
VKEPVEYEVDLFFWQIAKKHPEVHSKMQQEIRKQENQIIKISK